MARIFKKNLRLLELDNCFWFYGVPKMHPIDLCLTSVQISLDYPLILEYSGAGRHRDYLCWAEARPRSWGPGGHDGSVCCRNEGQYGEISAAPCVVSVNDRMLVMQGSQSCQCKMHKINVLSMHSAWLITWLLRFGQRL